MLCCTWNNGKVIGLTMWCFQDSVGILDTYVDVACGNPSTIDNWENLRPKLWQQRHSVTYYVNLVAVSQVLFVLFLQWYCTVILFFENNSSDKWRRGSISTGAAWGYTMVALARPFRRTWSCTILEGEPSSLPRQGSHSCSIASGSIVTDFVGWM